MVQQFDQRFDIKDGEDESSEEEEDGDDDGKVIRRRTFCNVTYMIEC